MKEKRLAPVFLDSRLEHPAGWIMCALQIFCIIIIIIIIIIIGDLCDTNTPPIPYVCLNVGFVDGGGKICCHEQLWF